MPLRPVPVPEADELSAPFFAGLAQGRLLVQRCAACGNCDLGRLYCSQCGAEALEWRPASGDGVVHSFVVMHTAYDPAHADQVPYGGAVVELAEGPRLFAEILGTDPADVRVGQRVKAEILEIAAGAFVPAFRPQP